MSDPFDELLEEQFEEETPPKRRGGFGGCLLNVLSGILVAGTLVVVLIFALVFLNPQISFNPFPPPTVPVLVLTSTPTPTPLGLLPPTWTPTSSPSPTPTETPIPTDTPIPSATPVPTADLESGTTFQLQEGSPSYEANAFHPEDGCNWLGVAGQVFDTEGTPVIGVLVEAAGTVNDEDISGLTLTGTALDYGEGGYEILLRNTPVDSEGALYIQLLDQANLPLTEKIFFQTYESCDSNLIKINFEQVPTS
jgi:hypothetical protein